MHNKPINSIKNTYLLTIDEKTIPFNVSITDIGDDKISKLRDENIKKAKKEYKQHSRPFLIIVALLFIVMCICELVPNSSQIYHIAAIAVIIFTCLAFIGVIIDMRNRIHFLNVVYDNVNGIKGWNAYQIASEIAFALDNIEPNSEIKLIKDVVKTKDPDIYLRIKDNDTKRINTYWLDDFSWEVHDEEEIVLIAQRINIDDITGDEPVYEMKLLVPQWIEDEYIVNRNLFA